jgi:alpha-N-arabinofuranosidase
MNRRRFLKAGGLAAMAAKELGAAAHAMAAAPAPRARSGQARVTVVMDEPTGRLNRNILGHFAEHLGACVYGGMWVGTDSSIPNTKGLRNDTIAALQRIHAPIIRWPGGCFADIYHWRDGIGPRSKRPTTWNLWWGREESNAFGTAEYMEYCRLSGASPYVCVNVGSGSVREAVEWMEYCNSSHATSVARERAANGHAEPYNVTYWSVGNENWGCGGGFTPEDYADRYARYVTYLARAAEGVKVQFVACGNEGGDWNQRFFEALLRRPAGRGILRNVHQLSIHHYFRDGAAVDFSDSDYYGLLAQVAILEDILRRAMGTLDEFKEPSGPAIGIALDEWGVWHPVPGQGLEALLQPNTLRDALLAAVTLNGLNSFGSRVSMACIAQVFNVLQCMAFTRGAQMVLTPTYYVFDLFQPHMDATGLKALVESPSYEVKLGKASLSRDCLSVSASLDAPKKQVCLTLVNQHLTDELEVEIELAAGARAAGATLRELASASVRDQNTFDHPSVVVASAQKRVALSGRKFTQTVPAHAVQALVLDLA